MKTTVLIVVAFKKKFKWQMTCRFMHRKEEIIWIINVSASLDKRQSRRFFFFFFFPDNKPSTDAAVPLVPDQYMFLIGLVKQHIKHNQGCRNIHYRHFDGFYKSGNAAAFLENMPTEGLRVLRQWSWLQWKGLGKGKGSCCRHCCFFVCLIVLGFADMGEI